MRINLQCQRSIVCPMLALLFLVNCRHSASWDEILNRQVSGDSSVFQLSTALNNFMVKYHLPALSVAVAKDGSLSYVRAFGLANLNHGEEASVQSLFRIAGISTAITALAVKKLVAEGLISYDRKIFGEGGILGSLYGHEPYSSWLREITVADLLDHTCGGWAGDDDLIADSRLRALFSSPDSAIAWALDKVPLKHRPGTSFDFSYLGYFILGRVIERVTREPYEKYVKEDILLPAGVTGMQVEDSIMTQGHEVSYYKDLTWPFYNGEIDEPLYFSRSDAALGWIASADELVKLMLHYKDLGSLGLSVKSSLKRDSLKKPDSNPDFDPDWTTVNPDKNWWEQFSIFGSTSVVLRSSRGFCWAVLINTYRPVRPDYFADLDSLINKTMGDTTIKWPQGSKK